MPKTDTHPSRTREQSRPWRVRLLRPALITCLLVLPIVAAIWLIDIKDLCAHNPHDPIDALVLSPNHDADSTMYIIIADQLFRSTNNGQSWQKLVQGLDHRRMLSFLVIAADDALTTAEKAGTALFVSSDGDGIYRSDDGGDSWSKVNAGLDTLEIGLLAAQPVNAVAPEGQSGKGIVLAAGLNGGLYRTETGGENWQRVLQDEVKIAALAFSPSALGATNSPDATAPSLAPVALSGDSQGVLRRSTDQGRTWARVWDAPRNSAITAIAFSPTFSSDSTLFIGTHDEGIFKSSDGGASFTSANSGLPFTWRDRYLALRASAGGPMLRKGEQDVQSIALSPHFDRDQTLYASLWNQAVYKSVNGGKSWRRHPVGLTCNSQADTDEHRAPHFRDVRIASDAESPSTDDYILFVGGFDGLFRSTDSGKHWQEIETLPSYTTGLAVCTKSQSAATADQAGTMSGTALPADIVVALSTAGDGTYVSEDGGASWTIHNAGLLSPDVSNITFGDDRLYASSVIGYVYRMPRIQQAQDGSDANQATGAEGRFDDWKSALMIPVRKTPLLRTALNVLRVPKWFSAHVFGMSAERMASSYTLAAGPTLSESGGPQTSGSQDVPGSQIVFVGTRHDGLLESTDGGRAFEAIWHPAGPDGKPASIMDLAVSPGFLAAADQTLFASVRGAGVWKSIDGGQTWQSANEGLHFVEDWASTLTLHALWEKDVKLALSPDYTSDQTAFAISSMGLWKTTDGAGTWQQAAPDDVGASYVLAVGISSDYTNDQTLLISIKGRGLLKSEDGGQTFAPVKKDPIARNEMIILIRYAPQQATFETDAHPAARPASAVYAASEQKLFVSHDDGDTWQEIARPSRHEDGKTAIQMEGSWSRKKGPLYSAGSMHHTEPDNASGAGAASATLAFYGTGVNWICAKASDYGIASVYVDGDHADDVDLYAKGQEGEVGCFSVSDLPPGLHVIRIESTGTKNDQSTGSRIVLDAFDVIP